MWETEFYVSHVIESSGPMGLLSLPGGTVEVCGGVFVVTMICDRARDARLPEMRGVVSLREKLTSSNSYLSVFNFW